MQYSITSKNTHQVQGPSTSPVPLTPQSSSYLLSELPAPPGRRDCEFIIGVETNNESTDIYIPMLSMPMLSPILHPASDWADTPPILKPRSSCLTPEGGTQTEYRVVSKPIVSSSYPHFPSAGTRCQSPLALDDESFSLSDDSSMDESFSDCFMASEVHFQGISRKEPTPWTCPLPLTLNGDRFLLQPRSPLSLRPSVEARDNSFLPLMPME
jgi:hypothetical protein